MGNGQLSMTNCLRQSVYDQLLRSFRRLGIPSLEKDPTSPNMGIPHTPHPPIVRITRCQKIHLRWKVKKDEYEQYASQMSHYEWLRMSIIKFCSFLFWSGILAYSAAHEATTQSRRLALPFHRYIRLHYKLRGNHHHLCFGHLHHHQQRQCIRDLDWGRDVQDRCGDVSRGVCVFFLFKPPFMVFPLSYYWCWDWVPYPRGVQTDPMLSEIFKVNPWFVSVFECSRHCFPIQTWSFSSLLEAIVGVSKQKARHVIHAAVRRLTRRPRGLTLVLNFFTTCSWEP